MSFKTLIRLLAGAILALGMLATAPASAQATRTWVSGVGDDANPCSRTAPCKTFAGSISKTAAGGEINCLDPGGFGAVTITKAITIICDYTLGSVLASGTNAININAATTDAVTLSGLDIIAPTSGAGLSGISVTQVGTLTVRNTTFKGFSQHAINFAVSTSSTSQLYLDNVQVMETGTSGNTATDGIRIAPASGATANVVLRNTRVRNVFNAGLRTDTAGVTGATIRLTMENSQFTNAGTGLALKAAAGTGSVDATIYDTVITQSLANPGYGIIANGSAVVVRVGGSVITGNLQGLLVNGGATVSSYGNNILGGNTTNGSFSGTIPLQ